MKRKQIIGQLTALTALAGASALAAGTPPARKPNIIVIFTDDQGYADLGVQGIVKDIKTPNIDALCNAGVRCTAGYITAPQCAPSRAGMLTGRYQQRFGINAISDNPMPLEEVTIAERLRKVGYRTGMVGKWHLDFGIGDSKALRKEPGAVIKDPDAPLGRRLTTEAYKKYSPAAQGFDEFYKNVAWWQGQYRWANYRADGSSLDPEGEWINETKGDRLDDETAGALAFIKRNHDKPFFLYMAYSGPHTRLKATAERLARFPGDMPERRRTALAMMATMDDGVGELMKLLRKYGIEEDTLIMFTSDNGAPLGLTMEDHSIEPLPDNPHKHAHMGGWDGSLNTPHLGEKGMITDGGVRVPFFVSWKGKLPAGKVYDRPVIALDFAATSLAVAGLSVPTELDGVNLLPYLRGEKSGDPHDALYWRFWGQAAIRSGDWKLLRQGDGKIYLFDLNQPESKDANVADQHPEKVKELLQKLTNWCQELKPRGLPRRVGREAYHNKFYFAPDKSAE
jgi:arylsulfatase A-like enzyme